ncbi:hypothetical protein MKQ68_06155 [Chitinophaga horti]|uniref:Uncharacterized protein n=1 Tax=Chitinophaga horti TaxID=2920382 RepID=A0ABY6J4R6_9BACT|nr:hypothetical protein [Chitinophaga horti]UYQ94671.1 hypothetical protein MKQ68_06155 [Chitinophaga horti]
MQQFLLKTNAVALLLVALFSLSAKAGGEYYRIFLNNKLLFERHESEPLDLKSLPLDNASPTDQLVIYYSHCGAVGESRQLSVRDENGKILKQWKYADTNDKKGGMSIPVKELLALKQAAGGGLNLYYVSKQLPKGCTLAALRSKVNRPIGRS